MVIGNIFFQSLHFVKAAKPGDRNRSPCTILLFVGILKVGSRTANHLLSIERAYWFHLPQSRLMWV